MLCPNSTAMAADAAAWLCPSCKPRVEAISTCHAGHAPLPAVPVTVHIRCIARCTGLLMNRFTFNQALYMLVALAGAICVRHAPAAELAQFASVDELARQRAPRAGGRAAAAGGGAGGGGAGRGAG